MYERDTVSDILSRQFNLSYDYLGKLHKQRKCLCSDNIYKDNISRSLKSLLYLYFDDLFDGLLYRR